jgi:diguanylate cyclase (GGDEF)-like protein/PAS domain S-box-containing protein
VYGIILSGLTGVPVLIVLWLVRKGRIRVSSYLFVFGIWVLDTILIYGTGGLTSGVIPGYVAVAVLGGLLLQRRYSIMLILLIAVMGLGMIDLTQSQRLPAPIIHLDQGARWLSLLINVILAATVIDLATSGLRRALKRARQAEAAIAVTNQDLKREISERIRTEDEIRKLKEFNENIVNSVAETIILEDEHGILTFANPRVEKLLGYSTKEIIGQHWTTIVPNGYVEKVRSETVKRVDGIESQYKTHLMHKDGTEIPVITSACPLFDQDRFVGVLSAFTDITEQRRVEEQLLHDAFHDELTGLPNRVLFFDRLGHTIARAKRHRDYHYGVLFLDLDRFKLVNDSLGHSMGDQMLILVAERLSGLLRNIDTIARLGGDEFVILLDDINTVEDAISIANRIQEALKRPFDLKGHEVYTTTSIGIVYNSTTYESSENVLRDADTAMYRAKRMGKDRFELFDPEMRRDVIGRMRVETELRKALEREEFRVFYQPLLSIRTDQVIGVEALVRWQHPVRGLLLPKDFLSIAEETGMIIDLGQWIFKEAARMIRRLNDQFPQEPPLFVSVNLSRRQFSYPGLIYDIKAVLDSESLDPRSFVLEIKEDVILDDTVLASEKIRQIQELGVNLQMDDFGTGYSSLARLNHLPIGALKIAREFILQIESGDDRSEIIRTIISLARILNINVIAEGVENSHQLDYLKKEECDIWQGYFCSKAINSEDLIHFMVDRLQPTSNHLKES